MGRLLDSLDAGRDIKDLNTHEIEALCREIRATLLETLSKTGGHLSSNLGSVELTIALHRALKLPTDKLIWDVGHQSYTHKLLTHRLKSFATLRTLDGISGFCAPSESEYDVAVSGHSSTSLSTALGLAAARDIKGEDYTVAAVIGDGALTGGLALEALNHIGHAGRKMLIILNDNDMSITKNVGGISDYLTRARTNPKYISSKKEIENLLLRIPAVGKSLAGGVRKIKDNFKYLISAGVLFEEMGLTYMGPIDGHNAGAVEGTIRRAMMLDEPCIIHVVTTKGKGCRYAQKDPGRYHGVPGFDIETGEIKNGVPSYSDCFGNALCAMAQNDEAICATTPSMTLGSGLSQFAKRFPKRFFDVGIAEGHAVTFGSALAIAGMKSVVAVYSSFLQRAYDSIIHDSAISNLHVVFAIDRAGLVPGDGATHQGVFDISFLSAIPNMSILSPSSFCVLEKMLDYAINVHNGPIAVRYPRGHSQSVAADFTFGKALVLREGSAATLVCEGTVTPQVTEAAELLAKKGISCTVIDLQTIKPLDIATVRESYEKTGHIFTFEAGIKSGGIGEQIECALGERVNITAIDGVFLPHATYSELCAFCALDSASIAARVSESLS